MGSRMGPVPISDLALELKRAVGHDDGARLYLDLVQDLALRRGLETSPGQSWLESGPGPGKGASKTNLQVGPDQLQQLLPANHFPMLECPQLPPQAGSEPNCEHLVGSPGW